MENKIIACNLKSFNTESTIEIERNKYIERLIFKETICFFYTNCVNRVDIARKNKNLKKCEICNDNSLVSDFFNGKCTKDNPYLITGNLIGTPRKPRKGQEDSREQTGIKNILGIKSEKDILWGTDDEIKKNLRMIYLLIMSELQIYCSEYIKDWENVLFDYVPYSKYKTLSEIKKKYNISLFETYGVYDEEVSESKLLIYQLRAVDFFFCNEHFRNDFLRIFLCFANEQKNFTHIDKKFRNEFIIKRFIPLLQKYKPRHETSLGLRVRDLLINDLQCVPELLLSVKNEKTDDYLKRILNKASSRYITELETIQNEQVGFLFK